MSLAGIFNRALARSTVACFSRWMHNFRLNRMTAVSLHVNESKNLVVSVPYCGTGYVEDPGPFPLPKQLTFEEVERRVMKAIRAWDRFPEEKKETLTLDTNFVKDMGFDSLDHVEIVISLEDEFGFEIPETDAEKLETPRDAFKYICEHEDVFE
ncbi:unnamed protein product [Thelazia callipaeda]|uniref:Acyl carrier protein n=1 Tax=Thelazia callipaeda TaxID=103827 RepID=A0A0N5CY75_THECL|nr:unnamed protein product [Thelazia callipaeda]